MFILTETLISLSPGPAVLLVLGLPVRHGFGIGFAATLGIITTNAVYFLLSALGVGALILSSTALFTVIKWIGAVYLSWLGINMLKPLVRRMRGLHDDRNEIINVTEAATAVQDSRKDFRQAFVRGFSLQAANPKNIAYFVATLPQFVSSDGNVPPSSRSLGLHRCFSRYLYCSPTGLLLPGAQASCVSTLLTGSKAAPAANSL